MEWSKYNYFYYSNNHEVYLGYNAISNVLIELNEKSYSELLNLKENLGLINTLDENHKFLIQAKFLVVNNLSDIRNIQLINQVKRFNNKNLYLTIAPTRACNFNCTYCYEKNRLNISFNEETILGIVNFIKNRKPDILSITWYGGEPLLAINDISKISKELEQLNINFKAQMVTNGYLLDRIANNINDLHLTNIQVTIDGLPETHNKRRTLKNNEDSFSKIIENIDVILLKNKQIHFSIRVNVDNENKKEFVKIREYLISKFGSTQLSVYVGYIHDDFCQGFSCIESSEQKGNFILDNYHDTKFLDKDVYPKQTTHGCMMRGANSFLIGPEGELYKCWHHLGEKNMSIGNVIEENQFDLSLYSKFMLANDSLFDELCQSCFLYPSCFGGCPDLRIKNNIFGGNDSVCIPAKENIEKFLDIYYSHKKADEVLPA